MTFLLSQKIPHLNPLSSAKFTVFTSKVSISFRSSNSLGKPQCYNFIRIRTYAQSIDIINDKKQLDYLQRKLKVKFNQILKLTSSKSRTQNQEKLDKIKKVNVEIGDLLFQIEVVSKNLLDRLSGKFEEEFHEDIKRKIKNYLEREERDFNIDEEEDDFYK